MNQNLKETASNIVEILVEGILTGISMLTAVVFGIHLAMSLL